MEECKVVKGNMAVSLCALVLSGVVYYLASPFKPIVDGAPGPGYIPKILAVAMAVLGVVLLAQTLIGAVKSAEPDGASPASSGQGFASPALKRVYKLIGLTVVYAALVGLVGFVVGSLVFIPSGMKLLGERNRKHMAAVSICIVVAFYLVFVRGFNMPLPSGVFFD